MSFDGWLDKENVVDMPNEKLLSHKTEENSAICNNTDEPWRIMLNEINQTKTNCMVSLVCRTFFEKADLVEAERRVVLAAEGKGKWRGAGQRVQTFCYKANKFWGSNGQHGMGPAVDKMVLCTWNVQSINSTVSTCTQTHTKELTK